MRAAKALGAQHPAREREALGDAHAPGNRRIDHGPAAGGAGHTAQPADDLPVRRPAHAHERLARTAGQHGEGGGLERGDARIVGGEGLRAPDLVERPVRALPDLGAIGIAAPIAR